MADKDKVFIFDTTMRDGEQSPGASMSLEEKIQISRVFDELGIKLSVPESAEIQLANLNWPMQPGSIDYLEYMRKQFIKLELH